MTDFEKLKKTLLKKGELFEDCDFPPIQSSVFYHQTPPYQFVWKRPRDICPNPVFISDTPINCFNLTSGKLGDQWFSSIIGLLYLTKGLFYRVVPADQSFDDDYVGMFRFRIWWNGEWNEVIIDDRLPTVNNKLVFVQALHGNQFWTALLEKAYCKLHGSHYECLKYGNSLDGLADLTGGITESISIKDPMKLSDILNKLLTMTSIITAVIQTENINTNNHNLNNNRLSNGILMSTNYRVMSIENVDTNDGDSIQLVRLRNPLGLSSDFLGLWKKESKEWERVCEDVKSRLNLKYLIEGEFWMSFTEFAKTFTALEVIHLDSETSKDEPSLRGRIPWQMKFLRGYWRKGVTAGGCRNNVDSFHINPQIQVLISESDEIIICLHQHSLIDTKVVGFTIYSTPTKLLSPTIYDHKLEKCFFKKNKSLLSSPYTNSKYVVLRSMLEQATYFILPTTYEPGQEGLFSVRVYSCKPLKLKLLECNPAIIKPAITKAPLSFDQKFAQYEALFMQLADEHKTINAFELQELLDACLPNDFVKSCATLEICRLIVATLESNGMGGRLNYKDYKNVMCSLRNWQNTFKNHTKSTTGILRAEKLYEALYDIGFQLNSDILSVLVLRYMRKDGTLRFGDFVSSILHLIKSFNIYEKKDPLQNGFIKLTLQEFLKISLQ